MSGATISRAVSQTPRYPSAINARNHSGDLLKVNTRSKKAKAILQLESGQEDPSHPSKVEQILKRRAGVLDVVINHLTNMLSVEYDPDKISVDEIRILIKNIPE